MLGGLYGDLPPPSAADEDNKPTTNSTVWSSATKMAPQTLRKPSSIFAPPQTILKSNTKPKPPTISKLAASPVIAPVIHSDAVQPALVGVTSTVLEEYDPARPNDYEEYRRERKKKAMEAEVRRELDRRRLEEEEKERRESEERERERDRDFGDARLNISGEEAWRRRAAMSGSAAAAAAVAPRSPSPPSNADGFMIGKSESGGLGVGAGGQMTAAQRMMAKMGWKQGQGLGKQEQGITTPLMAKKTDRRAGVIVNTSETKPEKKAKGVSLNGPPTRVLLLRNMVGPGQVDDELEDEVASECAKYGTVTRVLIFEITDPGVVWLDAQASCRWCCSPSSVWGNWLMECLPLPLPLLSNSGRRIGEAVVEHSPPPMTRVLLRVGVVIALIVLALEIPQAGQQFTTYSFT